MINVDYLIKHITTAQYTQQSDMMDLKPVLSSAEIKPVTDSKDSESTKLDNPNNSSNINSQLKNVQNNPNRDIMKSAIAAAKYSYDDEFKTWVLKILNSNDETVLQVPSEVSLKIQQMIDDYVSGSIINLEV